MTLDPMPLTFRPLTLADLPLLQGWFAQPHVAHWYRHEATLSYDGVVAKYAPRIHGREPVRAFIIAYGTHPIGYIHVYMLRDYPTYTAYIDSDDGTAGVDLFIGDPAYVNQGLGAPLLARFLHAIVFAAPAVTGSLIDPAVANVRAIRCYEKAGYRHLTTLDQNAHAAPVYLMYVDRHALTDRPATRTEGADRRRA